MELTQAREALVTRRWMGQTGCHRYVAALALAASGLPSVAPTQVSDSAIGVIRDRYATINRSVTEYRSRDCYIRDFETEGSTCTAYFDGGHLRKIVAEHRAGIAFAREEFYFWGDTLFFALYSRRRATPLCPSISGIDEDRYYFRSGRLFRWRDRDGKLVVIDQPVSREQERVISAIAMRYASRARARGG
jgi:hypothetical protein